MVRDECGAKVTFVDNGAWQGTATYLRMGRAVRAKTHRRRALPQVVFAACLLATGDFASDFCETELAEQVARLVRRAAGAGSLRLNFCLDSD